MYIPKHSSFFLFQTFALIQNLSLLFLRVLNFYCNVGKEEHEETAQA